MAPKLDGLARAWRGVGQFVASGFGDVRKGDVRLTDDYAVSMEAQIDIFFFFPLDLIITKACIKNPKYN